MGKDVVANDGKTIPNYLVTGAPDPPKSYAYCSDTAYFPKIVPQIENATVLYHEATFLEENQELAEPTKHSTAKQAAEIAKKAKVKTLILGHYSTRYANINLLKKKP